jgi:hypothetical protein
VPQAEINCFLASSNCIGQSYGCIRTFKNY